MTKYFKVSLKSIETFTVKGTPEYKLANENPPFSKFLFWKTINNFQIHVMDLYLPKREFNHSNVKIDSRFETSNQMIYDFKEGRNTRIMADNFAHAFINKFGKREKEEYVFMPIPASTVVKNEKRFRLFCKLVCDALDFENGYESVSLMSDRQSFKGLHKELNKISNLQFNSMAIKGKKVILFDDVITSGASFKQMSNKIKSLGATKVFGFFLAMTKAS